VVIPIYRRSARTVRFLGSHASSVLLSPARVIVGYPSLLRSGRTVTALVSLGGAFYCGSRLR